MDLRRFYHVILKDDALADMSVSYINDDYFMSKIAAKMKPVERELMFRLNKVRPLSGFYEITIYPDKYFYLIKNRILLPGGSDSGFIHVDVVRRLVRLIKIHDSEKRYDAEVEQTSEAAYNALKLRITLPDAHTPIWRTISVPANINFYELHLVIQKAMGWQNSHPAAFFGKKYRIHVHKNELDQASAPESGPELLLADETGVDERLSESGRITYVYDYGDHWEHEVELLEHFRAESPVIPEVLAHKGPGPIEDSGGTGGFEEMLRIIKDKSHPDHAETLNWAKSQNYKARYPKKSINGALEKLFGGSGPITESNDPSKDE